MVYSAGGNSDLESCNSEKDEKIMGIIGGCAVLWCSSLRASFGGFTIHVVSLLGDCTSLKLSVTNRMTCDKRSTRLHCEGLPLEELAGCCGGW